MREENTGDSGTTVPTNEMWEADKRLIEQLRRRVDELETLFDIAPVGLAIARDAACRRIDANPTFRRLLRLPIEANASRSAPEGERPMHFRVMRDGVEIPIDQLPMQVAARTGEPVDGSHCHVEFDDGSVIHLIGSSVPLFDENAKPRGCIGAFLDATPWKRVEGELKAARETAEAANRAKDHFLAVVSHELRGPLFPMSMTLSLWERNADEMPPEYAEDVQSMKRSVNSLHRLIDDLTDFNAIANDKMVVKLEPLDVHEVLRESIAENRGQFVAKTLAVEFVPGATRSVVRGDAARLGQVFGNVLRNAIKFTSRGTIRVSTSDSPRMMSAAGKMIRIEVRDTGIGLAESVDVETLFEPFKQAGAAYVMGPTGLGLGLSICRGLVHAHGGTISLQSDGPDLGTTVTIYLPLIG